MILQFVRFETTLTEDEVRKVANERAPEFRALPGLVQKYYVKLGESEFGGVYLWDSKASMAAYRESELAASIPDAYKVKGKPIVEISEVMFPLRG